MSFHCLKSFLPVATSLFLIQSVHAHGAHEHGSAKIDIAVQDTSAKIIFEAPSISVYGFEHEAKNAKDKKIVADSVEKFKKNIDKIVIFNPALGCTFSPSKIEPFVKDDDDNDENNVKDTKSKSEIKEGGHGDFKAEINVKCKKDLSGSKVTFGFNKYFPNVKKIDAQGLSNSNQTAVKVTKKEDFLQL